MKLGKLKVGDLVRRTESDFVSDFVGRIIRIEYNARTLMHTVTLIDWYEPSVSHDFAIVKVISVSHGGQFTVVPNGGQFVVATSDLSPAPMEQLALEPTDGEHTHDEA